MSNNFFYKVSTFFLVPLLLAACQPQDFGKIKPDFSRIKKVSASGSSIEKRSIG